jgi:hypothetical protein
MKLIKILLTEEEFREIEECSRKMQLVLIREIISKVRSKGNLTIEDYKDE